jgi:hypothetical protein
MTTDYTLAYGTHADPEDGRCAMEWVSHIAGESHSDQPTCVSPVVRAVCIALNDELDAEPRQRLRPYLSRTIGTAGDGLDLTRAWIALDWLIREYTPRWLSLASLDQSARRLSSLSPVLEERALHDALPLLESARSGARAARSHERAHCFSPARAVARETAWSCAGAAAWAAARLAVGDLAGDRARSLARCAAGDAAATAAQNLVQDRSVQRSRAAAKEAARAALAPTVTRLQDSVLMLLDRMLPLEPVPLFSPGDPAPDAVFTRSV